jgi:hypothetical protein
MNMHFTRSLLMEGGTLHPIPMPLIRYRHSLLQMFNSLKDIHKGLPLSWAGFFIFVGESPFRGNSPTKIKINASETRHYKQGRY